MGERLRFPWRRGGGAFGTTKRPVALASRRGGVTGPSGGPMRVGLWPVTRRHGRRRRPRSAVSASAAAVLTGLLDIGPGWPSYSKASAARCSTAALQRRRRAAALSSELAVRRAHCYRSASNSPVIRTPTENSLNKLGCRHAPARAGPRSQPQDVVSADIGYARYAATA